MTYTIGTSYISTKTITMADLNSVCELLSTPNVEAEVEGISEGGIKFHYKNIETKQYKSIRLDMGKTFPYLPSSDDVVLLKPKDKITTYLKAFYNSPSFTIEELLLIEDAFKTIGLIRKGKHPSKKRISERIDL